MIKVLLTILIMYNDSRQIFHIQKYICTVLVLKHSSTNTLLIPLNKGLIYEKAVAIFTEHMDKMQDTKDWVGFQAVWQALRGVLQPEVLPDSIQISKNSGLFHQQVDNIFFFFFPFIILT